MPKMPFRFVLPGVAVAVLALSGCAGNPSRFIVPPAPVKTTRIAIAYGTVAVRDVSLPTYAASEEIHILGPDGALKSSPLVLWADDPVRAMTGDVARSIGRMTGARVAAEPWPFAERAQAVLEIRVAEMLATDSGQFRLSGQYFVAPDMGGRPRAGAFDVTVPLAAEGGPAAIAAARGQAMREMSEIIVRKGLR